MTLDKLDITWLILLTITMANALVAETAEPHLVITAIICFSIAYKGRRIIDNFMELAHANDTIKKLMRAYFYIFPALIFLTDAFSTQLAALTTL
ncbi:cytochrome C oxidase subunit IV family protein [Litorilituus lipolyticus]|uniref:Thiosulfate reductase n=1 Tax=Litorilituus lipolyticus TaxID=2491017 RepID=A0A502KNZ4_9GAMM|nr:cytochrome C oxidase subunit IV family protein [Litorilituus lipolyticus]TPH13460.1 thiosulfate reductase [Litorilituus lipolyticus]